MTEKKQTFADKRTEMLLGDLRLKRHKDDGRLVKLFSNMSFAIVDDDMFVPIIPRHMSKENWRELYWHQPTTLVIHGQKKKTLCSICRLGLSCRSKGQGRSYDFKSLASRDTLLVPLTTRKKGEP